MSRAPVNYVKLTVCMVLVCCIFLLVMTGNVYAVTLKGAVNGIEVNKGDNPIENITLKVDEPFSLDFYITTDKDGFASVLLKEPGSHGLESYKLIGGDSIGDYLKKNCTAGVPTHYHWVLAPNGKWTEGNDPINIVYATYEGSERKETHGTWGFFNPYISSEHYIGTKSTSTQSGNSSSSAQTPGFLALPAIAAFLVTLVTIGLGKKEELNV